MSRVYGQSYTREESSWTERISCDMCSRVMFERAVLAEIRGRATEPAFVKNEPFASITLPGRTIADSPPPIDFCATCYAIVNDFLCERGMKEPTGITRVYMPCRVCNGTGDAPGSRYVDSCEACRGEGNERDSAGDPVVVEMLDPRRCSNPDCRDGNIPASRCPECKGARVIDRAERDAPRPAPTSVPSAGRKRRL